ncbi:MAG: DUF5050 domain-containing protein [Clostridia bacterium]|nr:DUF5050 domain-containing protein [Clostridia bacterium]
MKKCLSVLAVLMLSLCFIFSGCSPKLELPAGNNISSNGGRVVMVDNYVYFANTFVDYTTLSGVNNTEATTEHNSLNRVKTNEYGFVTKDDDDVIENNEVVYSKMAGFNNSNMFVVGSYLYYTSPNAHKDKNGNDLFDKTTLFRMKLDGTMNKEVLSTETSQGEFYLVTGETNYLLIFDNNKIQKLTIGDNLGSLEVLAEDVMDTVFPKEYGNLNTVYYTKDIREQDKNDGLTGNQLYKLDLQTKTSTQIGKPLAHTVVLVAYENNVLYYQKSIQGEVLYYANTMVGGFETAEKQLTYLPEVEGAEAVISNFTPINAENYCFIYSSKLMLNNSTTPLVDSAESIQMVYGDYIYYTTTDGLYRISYKDKTVQTVAEVTNIQANSCEVAGEYVYFYATLKDNTASAYYCYRANNKTIEYGRTQVDCIAQISVDDLSSSTEEE